MTIERVEDEGELTPSQSRTNYADVAVSYNSLELGEAVRLKRVTNITNFKKALERRGIKENTDFKAFHRGKHCVLRRFTRKKMTL